MGKLAIFLFAAWAGVQGGGVVVGLAMAGVLLAATSTAASLMQVRQYVMCRSAAEDAVVQQYKEAQLGEEYCAVAVLFFGGRT